MIRMFLDTPPVPCVVPVPPGDAGGAVFDAYGWCASDVLEWGRPEEAIELDTPIDGSDPARMVFVLRGPCAFLPRELARLHAFGLGLADEEALAPYAIDDATDELYARRVRPADLFWLAADNLNALVWGLHDWAHFHNHGPFVERAWTELQCDSAALVWLWLNRGAIGIDAPVFARVRAEIEALGATRFAAEGKTYDPKPLARLLDFT
jgi:hypothetical protein